MRFRSLPVVKAFASAAEIIDGAVEVSAALNNNRKPSHAALRRVGIDPVAFDTIRLR